MEFAAAALSSIAAVGGTAAAGAGVSAAGAGAATVAGASVAGSVGAAAGAAGSLFSMSTVASILSAGATALSVLGTMRAGQQRARSLELAAEDAEFDAKIGDVETAERRTGLKRALVMALGERDVATAASGVDLSFGTPSIARGEAAEDADDAISRENNANELRRARLAERSASYRRMASESRAGGLGRAAALALEGGAKIARRG